MPKVAHSRLDNPAGDGKTIGDRLREYRKKQGLTQVELSEAIGIDQSLLSVYETGKTNPPAEMLAHFSTALDVSTDELLGLTGGTNDKDKPHGNSKFMRRIKKLEALPPALQKQAISYIDYIIETSKGNLKG